MSKINFYHQDKKTRCGIDNEIDNKIRELQAKEPCMWYWKAYDLLNKNELKRWLV